MTCMRKQKSLISPRIAGQEGRAEISFKELRHRPSHASVLQLSDGPCARVAASFTSRVLYVKFASLTQDSGVHEKDR